jgi:cytochrome c oxidase subunit IV
MRIPRPPRPVFVVWLLLLFWLAANTGLAFLNFGAFGPLVHVTIAATMAAMVLVVFMELDRGASLFWVFAGAGFFWLTILFALTAADYLTRYSFAPV